MSIFLSRALFILSLPISTLIIPNSRKIHPSYGMTQIKKIKLGTIFLINTSRIPTGTTSKSHLVMALKILETPPEVGGDVVECGTWKGGCAVNLSIVCKFTGRKLKIYDSFEGLPEIDPNDREAQGYSQGDYCGNLKDVESNLVKYGEYDSCELIQGWFEDTLPRIDHAIIFAFIDIDFESSLDTCVRNIWNNLSDNGHIFIDEFLSLNYCSLFFFRKVLAKSF